MHTYDMPDIFMGAGEIMCQIFLWCWRNISGQNRYLGQGTCILVGKTLKRQEDIPGCETPIKARLCWRVLGVAEQCYKDRHSSAGRRGDQGRCVIFFPSYKGGQGRLFGGGDLWAEAWLMRSQTADDWGKTISGKGNSQCKNPEAERRRRQAGLTNVDWTRKRQSVRRGWTGA